MELLFVMPTDACIKGRSKYNAPNSFFLKILGFIFLLFVNNCHASVALHKGLPFFARVDAAQVAVHPHDACEKNKTFNVGTGIYDITGPAAEQGMMGYGMINQQTAGILMRLYARAFVIESPCNNKRLVFVNADLGQVFQGIKLGVIQKLKAKYGKLYTDDNVLITATHTHSGPGGFSTYLFYNLTSLGFSRDNFQTIIDGIVAAVSLAHDNMQAAQIKIAKGMLTGLGHNRSKDAYLLNPKNERDQYQADVDSEMSLIRIDAVKGNPLGIINWFPLHGVSFNNKNKLINGDNKGYAEYLFEQDFKNNKMLSSPDARGYRQPFVAAFAQAHAGDVSPNLYGHEGGEGKAGLDAMDSAGRPQYEKAKRLYKDATHLLRGGVNYAHLYLEMDKLPPLTKIDENQPSLCTAAIGVSMLAGTQDGEGVGKQGVTCDDVSQVVPWLICQIKKSPCQGVKPIALETGAMKPYPWTPNILPLQVFKVGNLIIAAVPFELTTMTGRRIIRAIKQVLPNASEYHIVLSTLANAYAGYVATHEEYQMQRYEAASTHFGPWSGTYLEHYLALLTKALINGEIVTSHVYPPDLSNLQINIQPGVVYDSTPLGKEFGDVKKQPLAQYKPGELVEVQFWGGHPKNDYRIQDTFLAVQYWHDNHWQTIRTDNDPDTIYHWQRYAIDSSLVTISWRIPKNVAQGSYRLAHYGNAKNFWTQKITPYAGYSETFEVVTQG